MASGGGKGGSGDDGGTKLGEGPFFELGKAAVKVAADGEFEDGVAEVFEPLVIGWGRADFGGEAGVREGFL